MGSRNYPFCQQAVVQKHKIRFFKKIIVFQGRLVVALSWVMEGLTIVREVVALS